jgi:hypothetical protein
VTTEVFLLSAESAPQQNPMFCCFALSALQAKTESLAIPLLYAASAERRPPSIVHCAYAATMALAGHQYSVDTQVPQSVHFSGSM